MPQMYIIYVKDSMIRIVEGEEEGGGDVQSLHLKHDNSTITPVLSELLAAAEPRILTISCTDPKKYLKKIKQELLYIKAAGGLIKSEKGEYLFIFRRGKWDLPKGKVESDEKTEQAAIREVQEECGLHISQVKRELESTYHVYEQGAALILKRTCWYLMKSHGEQQLIPQAEEDITEARWFKTDQLELIRKNTYPSVLQVMHAIQVPDPAGRRDTELY